MIVGAQLLNAVNSNVPGYAGIIIIAAATFVVTLFGYKIVHLYAYWFWIPCFIIFVIVLGGFAPSGRFWNFPMQTGNAEAGSIPSFVASVFGFGTGWTSYAADYTVYQPCSANRVRVFALTFGGLIFSLCFTEMLGLAVATATVAEEPNIYLDGYKSFGIGGLLTAVLLPPLGRFGQFCLVVLALSSVANICPNIYTLTFSLQVLGRWTQAAPRFIWTFISTLVYCAVPIPGYSHFQSVLENFMLLIIRPSPFGFSSQMLITNLRTFLLTPLFLAPGLLARHLRRHRPPQALPLQTRYRGLRPLHLHERLILPPGIVAILAFCFGVFGAVMGMAQKWFTGPIGRHIGLPGLGGDVRFSLAFAFAAISYVGFRTVEKRRFGR